MADVAADLEKLLQSGSLNNHEITEKLVDDIGSKYRAEQQSLQNLELYWNKKHFINLRPMILELC